MGLILAPAAAFYSALLSWLPGVVAIVAFRSIPFACHALTASRMAWPNRILPVALITCAATALVLRGDERNIALSLYAQGYILCGAVSVCGLVRILGRRPHGPSVILLYSGTIGLAVPALVSAKPVVGLLVVLGWDFTFSCYSYARDTRDSARTVNLRECLWFLFVDPTLVFAARSRRLEHPPTALATMPRIAVGVLALMIGGACLNLALAGLLSGVLLVGAFSFFGIYLLHSGLASVQIGLMRSAGYEAPERYRLPFLADGPLDFWRRWNLYVGEWFRRYVFVPTSVALGKSARRHNVPGAVATAAALTVTFVLVGVAHDLSGVARGQRHLAYSTLLFTGVAFLAVVWHGVGLCVRRQLRALPRALPLVVRQAPRISFAILTLLVARWWI